MSFANKGDDFKKEALSIYELEKKARSIAIPTSDDAVKAMLRKIGEPRILFGEDPGLRRERLRGLLAKMDEIPTFAEEKKKEERKTGEIYYVKASEELRGARMLIAQFSLERSKKRLDDERLLYSTENVGLIAESSLNSVLRSRKLEITSSQLACERPISSVKFSPQGNNIVTSSWKGVVKVWDYDTRSVLDSISVNAIHIHDVDIYPHAKFYEKDGDHSTTYCAAASGDGTCSLINAAGCIQGTLNGHVDKVNCVRFHPLGHFVGTTSMDNTMRFWDLESMECLLVQEGHSYGVYALAFHPDGSLAATGGVDSSIRIWDLRTGKNVMDFTGHISKCLSIDMSPNGVTLASGGADNAIIIWDLRKKSRVFHIPAHNNVVSTVKFIPGTGDLLFSCSYDGTIRCWQSADPLIPSLKRSWKPTNTLTGHDSKILSMDVTRDLKIASASYDRTWKLWTESLE